MQSNDEPMRWLDQPQNVSKLYWALWIACGLLLLVEPLIHKHGEVAVEDWFGFHGWFSFVGCVVLVLLALALRRILMRPEDYYER
jgi:hypothetical protein